MLETGEYSISGKYGTLRVKADGTYTYTVNQAAYDVEALNTGSTAIKDEFNYTVTDGTLKSDIGVLVVSINGANDSPTVRDLPTTFTAVEDQKTALLIPATFALTDPDSTYFSVGKIGDDQLKDLAARREMNEKELQRLLAPNL